MSMYGSVSEAEEYFQTRYGAGAWDALANQPNETKDKIASLTTATHIIDRLNFKGCRTSTTQDLQFPRDGNTAVPIAIKLATYEIALALLDGVEPEMEFENLFLTSQGYANVRSGHKDVPQPHHLAGVPSFKAWTFLRPYMQDPNELKLDRVS